MVNEYPMRTCWAWRMLQVVNFFSSSGPTKLEPEWIFQVDVQNVIGHGADQRHFTRKSADLQDCAMFVVKSWDMFSFVKDRE